MNRHIEKAYSVLEERAISKKLALELSRISGSDLMDLISLALKIKNRFSPSFHMCSILNAKSGRCRENCKFCAQSAHHKAKIDVYPLISKEKILECVRAAHKNGVRRFGIVTGGAGYKKINSEFLEIILAIDEIHNKLPDMKVCASVGNLSDETAKELSKHNVESYNLNIQVNPARYNELVATTHNLNERIETIRLLRKYGIKLCAGGIIGLGEKMEDRVELAFYLRELDVNVIPLNVLIPIGGTPLENAEPVPAYEVAKTFAIFRLVNPEKDIKFAAGRETKMKDFQALLMLAGANGFITGGYLTTGGREVSEDMNFYNELVGFCE